MTRNDVLEGANLEAFLPHRTPFLFLDRVIELHPGEHAVGTKFYDRDNPVFRGSSPCSPSVPPGILIESMAQLSAVVSLPGNDEEESTGNAPRGYLIAINKFEYLSPVLPGSEIVIKISLTHTFGLMKRSECSIECNSRTVATAVLSFQLQE